MSPRRSSMTSRQRASQAPGSDHCEPARAAFRSGCFSILRNLSAGSLLERRPRRGRRKTGCGVIAVVGECARARLALEVGSGELAGRGSGGGTPKFGAGASIAVEAGTGVISTGLATNTATCAEGGDAKGPELAGLGLGPGLPVLAVAPPALLLLLVLLPRRISLSESTGKMGDAAALHQAQLDMIGKRCCLVRNCEGQPPSKL
mmetsp:Transcript_57410/g.186498  ORF Transcript_57410/g.186498 Transcript_57410/m.186498 type:complete len:204 (+) Transcript_57410:1298-1909(+)